MPLTSVPTLPYQPPRKRCPSCGTTYDASMLYCPTDGKGLEGIVAGGGLEGRLIDERYLVKDRIGEGGMGSVWRGEQVRVGRPAALKFINPEASDDPQLVARFRREALSACRINHPNVVATYDFGETTDGMFYIAMELVEGGSLAHLLAEKGALPPERAAHIARQVSEALGAAEDMGVVHRDLKPENVMLTRRKDGSDLAKVVDFGIAKANWRTGGTIMTSTGIIVGTPAYVSPEQLVGEKAIDGRSDQYALALITFEMLTGKKPFPARTFGEAMRRLTEPVPKLRAVRPELAWPDALQATLERALDPDPDVRFASSVEFGHIVAEQVATWRGVPVGPRYTPLTPFTPVMPMPAVSAAPTPAAPTPTTAALAVPAPVAATGPRWGLIALAVLGVGLLGAVGGAFIAQLGR
jgi:eukaryotic-like serine/threonine-protein kinase